MAFEAFRVLLFTDQPGEKVAQAILTDQHAIELPSDDWRRFELRDGRHIIEVELEGASGDASLRFAICHPPSIDTVFISVVVDIASRLGGRIRIAEGKFGEADFSPPFQGLEDALRAAINQKRHQWKMAVGGIEKALTCDDAIDEFFMPLASTE